MTRYQNRVPGDFFTTTGQGESNVTIHAGSYHLAMRDAGIEMCNLMTYSSILPAQSEQVPYPGRGHFVHGEVMESIIAASHVGPGERATAGIIYAWLRDPETGAKHGGLVCEYSGGMPVEDLEAHLRDMLDELYLHGYEYFELQEPTIIHESFVPTKAYGTALAALCFTNFTLETKED